MFYVHFIRERRRPSGWRGPLRKAILCLFFVYSSKIVYSLAVTRILLFSVLISIPYLVDVLSSLSVNSLKSSSFPAIRSISSARRRFEVDLPPAVTVPLKLSNASVIINPRNILNKYGERTHACLTPIFDRNHLLGLP